MGKKTEKKIKSDRINALRKQYDSFLEEDKKRKERNDYILGRLDKMRYSTMAVQIHQTPLPFRDVFSSSLTRQSYQPEKLEPTKVELSNTMQMIQPIGRPSYQNMQLDIPRDYTEEASILKEISKKYILIPKLRTNYINVGLENMPPPITESVAVTTAKEIDSNDWKSKYDILETLKSSKASEEISKLESNLSSNLPPYGKELPVKDVPDKVGLENLKGNEKHVIMDSNDQIPRLERGNVTNIDSSSDNAPYYNTKKLTSSDEVQKSDINTTSSPNSFYYDETPNETEKMPSENGENESNLNSTIPENTTFFHDDIQNKIEEMANADVGKVSHIDSTTPENTAFYYDQTDNNVENLTSTAEEQSNVDSTLENNSSYYDQTRNYEPYQDVNAITASQAEVNPESYAHEQTYYELSNDENNVNNQQINQDSEQYPIEYDQYMPEIVNNAEVSENASVVTTKPDELEEKNITEKPEQPIFNTEVVNPPQYYDEEDALQNTQPQIAETQNIPDSQNNQEQDNLIQENTEDYTAGIEEFEAEQTDMFVASNPEGDYAYNQGEAYPEYSQEQNYAQQQDHSYYEQTQQEGYPVNEYEETQQNYDPTYAQQYAATYGNEEQQQNVYMEHDPNLSVEQSAPYDVTQVAEENYGNDYAPGDVAENLENTLDQEDGLLETPMEQPPNETEQAHQAANIQST